MADITTSPFKTISVTEARELYFAPVVKDPAITEFLTVYTSLNKRKKIHTFAEMQNILRLAPYCGLEPNQTLSMSTSYFEPNDVGFHEKYCFEDLKDSILQEDNEAGTGRPNLQGKLISQILNERVVSALPKNLLTIAFWANKLNVDPRMNQIDGIWKRVTSNEGSGATQVPTHVSTGSGTALSANAGLAILKSVYNAARTELQLLANMPNETKMYVTLSIWNNLCETMEASSTFTSPSGLTKVNGKIYYKGTIEVVMMPTWDVALASGLATGTAVTIPHYIMFAAVKNLVLATDLNTPDPSNVITSWYNQETEFNHIKGRMRIDAGYIFPQLIAVGY